MNIEIEENKIVFTFKNAEEQKRFAKVLKQTRDSVCGRRILLCNTCPLAEIQTKSGSVLCEVIENIFMYLCIK